MLALSPPLFPTFGWSLEESISHEQDYMNNIYRKIETSESSFLQFPYSLPEFEFESSTPSAPMTSGDPTTVKKLNHNASERDRRKKINSLYSSLRSLLPATDHMKKLSIPTTISRVVRYIPELQQQVETLTQKKEKLLSKINTRQGEVQVQQHKDEQRKIEVRKSLSNVSVSRIGDDGEFVVQMSTILKVQQQQQQQHTSMLNEVLMNLQEDELHVINVSSFESNFGGRVFYNIHLQHMEGTQRMECEVLTKKLLSFIV